MGGLGNQMFQYAIGRKIALANGAPLKLDIMWHINKPDRPYSLHHFAINAEMATEDEIAKLSKAKMPLYKRVINSVKEVGKPYYLRSEIHEKCVDFDPNILHISDGAYLNGYWQSEKYFKDIEEVLRSDFKVIEPLSTINMKCAQQIITSNAIAIHVRRGDYVSNPATHQVHGTCSLDYYQEAMDLILSKVQEPHFFVFSDDPKWALENIRTDSPITYVCNNPPERNYDDLRLMSLCKHFIIANSSFSWWGAWLSENDDKIVVAPAQWFQGIEYNDADRLPESWIQV